MEKKLKHLDFLQLVITRMSVNSFLLKGWTVTIISALFAFAAKDANDHYVLISYIATPLFWALDAYYLSLERQYRGLYNHVRRLSEDEIDFSLDARTFNVGKDKWIPSILSRTLLLFYGALMLIVIFVMFLIK